MPPLTLILGNGAPLGAALLQRTDHPLPLLCVTYLAMGLGIGIANVHAVSLRQTVVPAGVLGRVNAAYRLISLGRSPYRRSARRRARNIGRLLTRP